MSKGAMWRAGTTAAACAVLGAGVGITASAASQQRSTPSVHGTSGDHLTIREGTSSMPYKTIQMTIPAGATVATGRSNGSWGDGSEGYGPPSGAWGGYGRTGSWTTQGVGAPAGW